METAHMPAPLHLLGVKPFPCGCGKDWGCIEAYTTLSGLPYLLADKIVKYPNHELARSTASAKEKVLSLRGLAQKGDPLAVEIFDFQARAMGLHVANLAMAEISLARTHLDQLVAVANLYKALGGGWQAEAAAAAAAPPSPR